jgi:hypothetical protein
MGGIEHAARGISAALEERLPWQRKTQRENLALLVATMLSERSANLMSLAAALPRQPGRIDMRYQWVVRVLANPLIECDMVMLPFANEVLARAQAEAGPGERVDLILDQSRASERHQILMLALRWGERALPLAWRVEETEGAIGFGVQKGLLDTVAAWLPELARVRLLGDRFYGTPALIAYCQLRGWDYRLRLKGNLRLWIDGADAGPVEHLARGTPFLTGVELTARRVRTNVGFLQDHRAAIPRRDVSEADSGHEEPWIVAMSEAPGYLATLDYARRWGIEPMFSDFKTRGFGLADSQIRYPDRLARLVLVMSLALYFAVSTGQWDAAHHATPAERKRPEQRPKNVLRSMTSWFTRGLRRIANLLQTLQPIPQLWGVPATDRW